MQPLSEAEDILSNLTLVVEKQGIVIAPIVFVEEFSEVFVDVGFQVGGNEAQIDTESALRPQDPGFRIAHLDQIRHRNRPSVFSRGPPPLLVSVKRTSRFIFF